MKRKINKYISFHRATLVLKYIKQIDLKSTCIKLPYINITHTHIHEKKKLLYSNLSYVAHIELMYIINIILVSLSRRQSSHNKFITLDPALQNTSPGHKLAFCKDLKLKFIPCDYVCCRYCKESDENLNVNASTWKLRQK